MPWQAGQNGIPESRIVRFLVGVGGYIAHLASSLRALLASNVSPLSIQVDDATHEAFIGYDYPRGVSPQIDSSGRVIASGNLTGGLGGYFVDGAFSTFDTPTAVGSIGAFRHQYGLLEVILRIEFDGHIYDSTTGVELPRSGAFGSSDLTYTVSRDGRAMLLENNPTFTDPPTRNVRRADIDRSGLVGSVTLSEIPQPASYGTETIRTVRNISSTGDELDFTESQDNLDSITRVGTYALTYGLDADGNTIQTTIDEASTQERTNTLSETFNFASGGTAAGGVTTEASGTLTITVPEGGQKTFPMLDYFNESVFEVELSGSGLTQSGDITITSDAAALGIIYSDPSNSFLLYEHNRTLMTQTTHFDDDGVNRTFTGTGSVQFIREVGVVHGAESRVLFTETSATDTTNGTKSKVGFIDATIFVGELIEATEGYSFTPATPESVDEEDESDITVDLGFFKKMKWVTDLVPGAPATPLNGGFGLTIDLGGAAYLFMRDVNAKGSPFQNTHKYWIAVRDSGRWLFGVRRIQDIDGNTINDLQLYSGNLNESELRTNYIQYLIDSANAADIPDAALIAQLQTALGGGGFGSYDPGLATQSRIPLT